MQDKEKKIQEIKQKLRELYPLLDIQEQRQVKLFVNSLDRFVSKNIPKDIKAMQDKLNEWANRDSDDLRLQKDVSDVFS